MIPAWTDILWQPMLPPTWITLLAATLAALALPHFLRVLTLRPVAACALLALRFGAIASLAVVLLGPHRPSQAKPTLRKPSVVIVVDTSASMLTPDCGGRSRLDAAMQDTLGRDTLEALRSQFDVSLLALGEALNPMVYPHTPIQPRSPLVSHLTAMLGSLSVSQPRPAAMVLLSDGRDTEGASPQTAARAALSAAVPIHTLTLGHASTRRDLWLRIDPVQSQWTAGRQGLIRLTLGHVGLSGARARLTTDFAPPRDIDLTDQEQVTVDLPWTPSHAGEVVLSASVAPLVGEEDARNNDQSLTLTVQPGRLRILLTQGAASWEAKFIAQSLRRDPRIDLVTVAQPAPGRRLRVVTGEDPGEELAKYDLVILGEGAAPADLHDYVDAGGKLVLLARTNSPLSPLRLDDRPTHSAPWDWTPNALSTRWAQELSSSQRPMTLQAVAAQASAAPGASVLATARIGDRTVPLLAVRRFGRGTVAAFNGSETWRWSLSPRDAGLHETFWHGLVHFLTAPDAAPRLEPWSLALSRLTLTVTQTLDIEVVRRWGPQTPPPTLTITGADGVALEPLLTPLDTDRWAAAWSPSAAGLWTLELTGQPHTRQHVLVRPDDTESRDVRADPSFMRELAQASGGQALEALEATALATLATPPSDASAAEPPRPVWRSAWVMSLPLLALGLEWLGRRRMGWP